MAEGTTPDNDDVTAIAPAIVAEQLWKLLREPFAEFEIIIALARNKNVEILGPLHSRADSRSPVDSTWKDYKEY